MDKRFYDICYEILSQYQNFPDVADTYKSIKDGIDYRDNYPQTMIDFYNKKDEIIRYITNVRKNNIIDEYKSSQNPCLLYPMPSGKSLSQATYEELYNNLIQEIPRLILKGMHQTIKHFNDEIDNNNLTIELLREELSILEKYNL